MSLVSQLTTLATRIATEFKTVRTEITNGLSAKANLSGASFTGDVSTSTKILVNASAGDEGGEIFLKKAVTNTTLTNGVTVDVYQNRLRFFEAGGTSRGYYVDVSAGVAGAGTNLLGAPGSTAITTVGTIGTGTWQGTDIGIAYGGTGASDAATARTNLGLAIGTNVQAYNATLASVAAGTYAGDNNIATVGTIGTGTWQGTAVGVAYGGSGATTGAGLVPVIPTSVSVGSGTGSADSTGLVTFSGVSSVSLNGVFSSAYKNYRLVVSDINSATGNAAFYLRLRSGTTDNTTVNYYQYWTMKRLNGTSQDNTGGPANGYALFHYDANTSYSWSWYGDINAPFAAKNTTVTGLGFGADATSTYNVNSTVLHTVASSFNGITFYPSTSTMSGTVRIYGYR